MILKVGALEQMLREVREAATHLGPEVLHQVDEARVNHIAVSVKDDDSGIEPGMELVLVKLTVPPERRALISRVEFWFNAGTRQLIVVEANWETVGRWTRKSGEPYAQWAANQQLV